MSEMLIGYKQPFTMVEDALIENENLSIYEKMVFIVLKYHADNETGKCFPGYERISRMSSCSIRTAKTAIKGLINKGYITCITRFDNQTHRFKSNLYQLNPIYIYKKPCASGALGHDMHDNYNTLKESQQQNVNNSLDLDKVDLIPISGDNKEELVSTSEYQLSEEIKKEIELLKSKNIDDVLNEEHEKKILELIKTENPEEFLKDNMIPGEYVGRKTG